MKSQKSFLNRITDEVINMPPESTLIIVPTRRAAVELKQLIARKFARPSILPVILGVSDFNERTAALPVVAEEMLLMELYSVYKTHDPKETIAGFSGWGMQLLKDFNEIDLQLVYANDLFRRMADLREMEMDFNPSEERDNFMQFWKELSGKEISPLQQQFIRYWELLPFVYHDFRNHLIQKGFAYEGLSLRLTAEAPELPAWLDRFTHVVYAGFYALNRVEEKFLEKAAKEKQLLVLKDADNWYVDNSICEAGMFFRKGYMSDTSIGWKENYLTESAKKYRIASTAGSTAMSREIAIQLSEQLKSDPDSATDTVVILPDENLLYSFLNFCQSLEIPVNPSMGFPLTHHPMWQVIEAMRMVRTGFPETNEPSVAHRKKELLEINPLIKSLIGGSNDTLPLIEEIILPDSRGILHEQKLLTELLSALETKTSGFTAQAAATFIHEVQNAAATLQSYHSLLEPLAWWKLMMDTLRSLRIPYKADREKGVHVMGFLETRVLDFSHVYIASMNEGKFPSSGVSTSLIPYVIRKYYGLPCREEQEAVTAYHFYRLLQRTEFVNLFYDDSPDAMGGGEKSRYLLQLFHELIPEQKNSDVSYLQIINPPTPLITLPVAINKTQEVMEKLETKYTGDKGFLSASALNTYIQCPLKFYFEQIAGIRSSDDATDTLEANILGQVLHRSMERIYANHKLITAELIDTLIATGDEEVLAATAEKYKPGTLHGHDLLMQEVIKKLVRQILENDRKEAPFEIVAVEKESTGNIQVGKRNVNLKGYIDRLDIHQNILRILDYKTGQDEAKMPPDSGISKLYTDPKYKTAFQLLFYLYLIQPEKNGKEAKAGIFRLSRDNQFSYLKDSDTTLLEKADFENNLNRIISEIYNPAITFSQTDDVRRCVFCDFSGICNRN